MPPLRVSLGSVHRPVTHSWISHIQNMHSNEQGGHLLSRVYGITHSLHPDFRSNTAFAVVFFLTRILLHIIHGISYFLHDNRTLATGTPHRHVNASRPFSPERSRPRLLGAQDAYWYVVFAFYFLKFLYQQVFLTIWQLPLACKRDGGFFFTLGTAATSQPQSPPSLAIQVIPPPLIAFKHEVGYTQDDRRMTTTVVTTSMTDKNGRCRGHAIRRGTPKRR